MSSKIKTRNLPLAELDAFIKKTVLPEMQMGNRPYTLTPTGLGNRNLIFFLKIDNYKETVFKCFANKSRIKNNLLAGQCLADNKIDAPEILFSDVSRKTFKKFGYYFSCEEKIEGKSLNDTVNPVEVAAAVAKFYAKMHAIKSPRWGKLTSLRKYGFTGYIMDKTTKWLNILKDSENIPSDLDLKACSKWFNEKRGLIKNSKSFSLCHGDVNKKNIMITKNKQIIIIDNEAIKNLPFAIEFFRLKLVLCEDSPEVQKIFEQSYFENCSPESLRELQTCGLFYKAYVLLEFAQYFNRKSGQHKNENSLKAYYESNRQKTLNNLKEIVHKI